MPTNKIAWEKWDDDIIEQEEFGVYNLEGLDEEQAEEAINLIDRIPKLIVSPMGIYQLHDKSSPSKQFNCWLAHTNFTVSDNVIKQIEPITGVEVLQAVTRYKFFLGVGKLFDFKEIRIEIEKLLCNKHMIEEDDLDLDDDTMLKIKTIKENVVSKKYWAIFIFPNGEIDYTCTDKDNDNSYVQKLALYMEAEHIAGGVLLTS